MRHELSFLVCRVGRQPADRQEICGGIDDFMTGRIGEIHQNAPAERKPVQADVIGHSPSSRPIRGC
nr:hypothetical protein [Nocardia transvalensis]